MNARTTHNDQRQIARNFSQALDKRAALPPSKDFENLCWLKLEYEWFRDKAAKLSLQGWSDWANCERRQALKIRRIVRRIEAALERTCGQEPNVN